MEGMRTTMVARKPPPSGGGGLQSADAGEPLGCCCVRGKVGPKGKITKIKMLWDLKVELVSSKWKQVSQSKATHINQNKSLKLWKNLKIHNLTFSYKLTN
jgi:hypothetical protein